MENHQNYQTSQVFGMALFVSLSLSSIVDAVTLGGGKIKAETRRTSPKELLAKAMVRGFHWSIPWVMDHFLSLY